MKLSLDNEQLMLKDSVARFVQDNCGVAVHRRLRDAGQSVDPALWQQMAELGWLGLPFTEADGGFDGSAVDVMVLMEELGRGLVVQPYVSTVLTCGRLLARCNQEIRESYLPALIAGDSQWALAFAEQRGRYKLGAVSCTASTDDGEHYLLSGEKIAVANGMAADHLLASAKLEDGSVGVFLIENANDARRRQVPLIDGTAGAAIEFSDTSARLLSGEAEQLLEDLTDEVILYMGAQGLGSMEALLDMTVEHCKTRQQFGQAIGSFQALQHRMADMYLHCQATRSLLYAAVLAHQEGRPDRAQASSALKVKLGEAGRFVSQQAVQLHGGIGMSDELAVGHHFKALLLLNTLFGDSAYHLERYTALGSKGQVGEVQ